MITMANFVKGIGKCMHKLLVVQILVIILIVKCNKAHNAAELFRINFQKLSANNSESVDEIKYARNENIIQKRQKREPRTLTQMVEDWRLGRTPPTMPSSTSKPQQMTTWEQFARYKYYNVKSDPNGVDKYWINMNSIDKATTDHDSSKQYGRTSVLNPKFPILFYDHIVTNLTVSTNGFIIMGKKLDDRLDTTRYIAPMTGNFDSSLSLDLSVKYVSDDNFFAVEWTQVISQPQNPSGRFTFQTTIFKNGTILFLYKDLLQDLPVFFRNMYTRDFRIYRCGLADDYIKDKESLKVWTYDEIYLRDNEKFYMGLGTAFSFTGIPNCAGLLTCEQCVTADVSDECGWCSILNKCSNGADKFQIEWIDEGCNRQDNNVTKLEDCNLERVNLPRTTAASDTHNPNDIPLDNPSSTASASDYHNLTDLPSDNFNTTAAPKYQYPSSTTSAPDDSSTTARASDNPNPTDVYSDNENANATASDNQNSTVIAPQTPNSTIIAPYDSSTTARAPDNPNPTVVYSDNENANLTVPNNHNHTLIPPQTPNQNFTFDKEKPLNESLTTTNMIIVFIVIIVIIALVITIMGWLTYIHFFPNSQAGQPIPSSLQRRTSSINSATALTKEEIDEFRNGHEMTNLELADDNEKIIMKIKYNEALYEIPKDEIRPLSTILGEGNFGEVRKAIVFRFEEEVAVKLCRKFCSKQVLKSMMSEIKIMSFVGDHDNIVKFLGAHTKELEEGMVYIVTELCSNGSLLSHLQALDLSMLTSQNVNKPKLNFELVKFSFEIASGMEYIASKKVYHGDLSAKNVLLDKNFTCKICDFGLSQKSYSYELDKHDTSDPLPWRWCAIECLTKRYFSIKSDIWSYGITLWEIFSLGHIPYPEHSFDDKFLEALTNGNRPKRPNYASQQIYDKMFECWNIDPNQRPKMTEICGFFESLKSGSYPGVE